MRDETVIERLRLNKFTVFEELDLNFSPGINLLIGQNGTGKTHILKILYTVLAALNEGKRISDKIVDVFLPKDKRIGRLVKRRRGISNAEVKITRNSKLLRLSLSTRTNETLKWRNGWKGDEIGSPVYIPVKEMLANAPGFTSLYNQREIHFEEVYADIVSKAFIPPLRGAIPPDRRKLLNMIQSIIEGKIIQKEEHFYLRNRQGELEFTLLAEGMRKLGLLWLLIQNGTLLKGATLFWDEPEANLNPSMLNTVVEILLHLQRSGVQVFIATHNYVLLKEFNIQKTSTDKVRFFSLDYNEETKKIEVQSGDDYLDIIPNKITEAYTDIYDKEVYRSLKGLSK